MKKETLDCFSFLRNAVAAIVEEAPVLRKLVLRDIVISFKISPWSHSSSLYCKGYVDFCVERNVFL